MSEGKSMASSRVFGDVVGAPVGTVFQNRKLLSTAGVHRPTMAGISGSGMEGADSIVLSGGYQDDEDYGDVIVYTGHGGRDPNTGRQIADQELTLGNLALAKSCVEGLPVRVVRRTAAGYSYDGLFYVERHWQERGRDGHLIWRYRIVRTPEAAQEAPVKEGDVGPAAARRSTTVQRIVRNTAVSQMVKSLHEHECQVCGVRIMTDAGPYAEGAHIRPLGRPHNGPDTPENVLCLCPNHHVQLDLGGIWIDQGLAVIERISGEPIGTLRTKRGHRVAPAHVEYHRGLFNG